MYIILWEYRVTEAKRSEFERNYGPAGPWVDFFRKGNGYVRTELLRDTNDPSRFMTLDYWRDLRDFKNFQAKNDPEYSEMDQRMAALTVSERRIGGFEVPD